LNPLNPVSLTCGLTAAEATQGKEQGKEFTAKLATDSLDKLNGLLVAG